MLFWSKAAAAIKCGWIEDWKGCAMAEKNGELDKKHRESVKEWGVEALIQDYMADTEDDEGALAFINSEHCTAEMVNHADDDGWTPLILAARLGRVLVVDALIKKGADVNYVSWTSGRNAMMYALADIGGYPPEAKMLQLATVRLLAQAGTNPLFGAKTSAYVLACKLSRMEALSELLKGEVDFGFRDKDGKTGADYLAENGNAVGLALVERALAKKASREEAEELGRQMPQAEEKRKLGI